MKSYLLSFKLRVVPFSLSEINGAFVEGSSWLNKGIYTKTSKILFALKQWKMMVLFIII